MKVENQLLARLVRAVTGKPEVEAEAPAEAKTDEVIDTVEAEAHAGEATEAAAETAPVEASTETLSLAVDTADMNAVISNLQTQVEAVKSSFASQLAEAAEALAMMTSKYEAAEAALATLAAEKVATEVAAKAAKLTARKAQVEAAIGTDKAAGLMLATEGLDDASFEAIVTALAGSVDAEAQSTLFQEIGATGVVDAAKIVAESPEMKILKQTYGAK